jgi:hypothetical protein
MSSVQSGQCYGTHLSFFVLTDQVRTVGSTNHQELSSSRDGWFVGSNDVLMGHRRGSVWDIHYITVSQHSASTAAAAIPALMLVDMGSMHVLRSSLVVAEVYNYNNSAMSPFRRYRGWSHLWYTGSSFIYSISL